MLVNEECARCAATEDLHDVTIIDESGGSGVKLCGNCRNHIDTPRCQVCGSRKTGWHKAETFYFSDDLGMVWEICDDCRQDLVFSPRRAAADG